MNRQNESVRLELLVLEVGKLRRRGRHLEALDLWKLNCQRAGREVDAARRILIALFRGRGRVGIRAVLEELIAAVRFRNCITSCVLDCYKRGRGVLRDREADPRSIVLVQRDGNRRKRRAVVRLLLGNCERIAVLCLVARAADRVGIRARRQCERLLCARSGIERLAVFQNGKRCRGRRDVEDLACRRRFPTQRGIVAALCNKAASERRRKVRRLHFAFGLEGALCIYRKAALRNVSRCACQSIAIIDCAAGSCSNRRNIFVSRNCADGEAVLDGRRSTA